jgi:hypothetical protein
MPLEHERDARAYIFQTKSFCILLPFRTSEVRQYVARLYNRVLTKLWLPTSNQL